MDFSNSYINVTYLWPEHNCTYSCSSKMSSGDDETLMSRFQEVFWNGFIRGCKPELIGLVSKVEKPDVDSLVEMTKTLLSDAEMASVMLSSNEELEDVLSSSLLFALLPFVHGSLLYHHTKFVRETRISLLEQVREIWDRFLSCCRQLGIECVEKESSDPRRVRIESGRRQNLLKPAFIKVMYCSDLDEARDSILDVIEYFSIECETEIRHVNDELELLKNIPETASEPSCSSEQQTVKKPWAMRLDHSSIRSLAAKNVFRPDISMPTMSLEEYLKREMLFMQEPSTRIETPGIREEADDFYKAEEAAEDEADQKARLWDDWKDDNPRGSGNKLGNLG